MRVLSITHERDAGPGVFVEAIAAASVEHDEWFRAETDDPPADPAGYDAVMTFGGSMHVDQEERHPWIAAERELLRDLLARGTPLLGVCLGAQLLSQAAGGDARPMREPEIGWFDVEVTPAGAEDPLLGPLAPRFVGFDWHQYECGLPADATVLARTPACAQAFRIGDAAWGIQFHAEVSTADVGQWIDDARDGDGAPGDLDPEALRARTLPRMGAWNELGRGLAERFIAAVGPTPRPPSATSSSSR